MGSSSSGYRAPVEAPNTLQSMQEVTIVEAISEGPIVGLYTGDEKSIALNKNPLKTPEGAFTYQNVSWDIRLGLPDQEPFADVAGTESETGVGVEVTKYFPRASGSGSGAVTRTITNPNVTHVRVTLGVQGLYRQILDDEDRSGDTEGETVSYRVTVKDKDNNVVVRDDQSRTDKTMSQAQWSIKYALSGGAPWTVTVTKLHDDNEKSNIKNDLYWSSYTEIINRKMIYPHTALMMVRGNAETFGSSIPSRAYRVKGLIVEVPGNYDPATRTYSGIWDGTFQNAWTDNPAWILRDLIESDRYGLKKFFPPRWINPLMDKWTLYEIAKICDESVDDGFGGTEPRYTFNGQIMGAGEAREVVQSIASVFHGMTYWGSALMYATCDYPTDPLRTLNQSTINDGTLSYSTGSAREIHSVALVTWYDPDNYGEATIETVVDWDKYQRYGKSEVKVTAYGCYSRGQAYRHGLWTLLTEDEQWQCTLEQGLEGYDLMPGTVIKIADPNIMGIRYSGRAVNIGVDSVTLDAPVSLTVGETYTLYIVADDGTEESREITSRGTSNVVNVSAPFSKTFSDNPAWSISGTDAAPREFAVRSLKEKQDGRVEVSLREVNSGKYLQLESGIVLKRPPVRIKSPHGYIAAPTGLEVYANTYFDNGTPRQRLTFSWSASGDSDAALYEACYKTPSGSWNNFAAQRTSSVDIPAAVPGEWLFRVRACSLDGRYSEWAEKSYTLGGIALIPKAPVNLRATGGFRCATVAWDMPDDPLIGYFEVLMASSEDVSDAAVVGKIYGASFDVYGLGVLDTRWFWVRSVSYADNGIYSDTVGPVSATTNALQASDLPDGTIQKSHLAAALQTEIAKIPDIEVDISDIVDDVAAREAQIRSDVETIKEGLQDDIALVDQKIESTAQDLSDLSDATDTAVSRLSGDISAAAQQAAANVEAAKALLRGESRNLTDEMMEQLDALSEAVIGTLSMVKDVGDRLSDAGVYVDPDNGEVRIYGLDVLRRETDLRISNAEIMLDAQAAKISQKVTLAQVDERIAGMAFDNVGQLLLEGVNARIDDVSQELDAQKVELRSKASSVIVQEHTARIAQAEADLQGLDAAIALKASLVELDLAVARIEAAELKIDAQNGTIRGFVGQYADDFDALAEGVIQNASNQFESDKANRQAIAYAKQELIGRLNIVDGRLEAEAASRLILEAQIKNAAASLISEKELRAREDEAIATLVDRVIVEVDANRAAIIEEAELRADKDEAYGKMHNAMIASVDDSAGDAELAALISGFRGEQSIRRQLAGFYSDLDARVKENEVAEATKREVLVAQMNENKALIETEKHVRATENEALALRIDNAFVEVGDAKAAITEEAQARADQYGALATQISGISAGSSIDKQELLDAIAAESQARIDAIEAEAAARGTALTAEEQARIAAIQQEAADRAAAIAEAVGEERRQRTADVKEVREANSRGLESYGTLLSYQIADSREADGEALMQALLSNENALKEQKRRLAAHYEYLDSRVNELGVAQAEDREALIVMMDKNVAAIKREQYVLADKNEALARDIQSLFVEVGDANAAIIAEQEARASADAAAVSKVDTLSATVESNKSEAAAAVQAEADARIAAIQQEAAARGAALTAEEQARIAAIQQEAAARQQAINSEAAARTAAVREERDARVSGDSALSGRINALVSDVGGAMSAITEEARTRADKDEAYGRLGTSMIAASDEDAGEAALYAAILAHDIGRKLTEQFAVYYNTLDTRIKQGLLSEAQARELMAAKLAAAQAAIETEATVRADRDGALASTITTVQAKVTTEETERKAAIQSEADARIAAIQAEAAARGTALTAEENARIAAIQAEATARQQAIDAEASARQAAIQEERTARVNADNALASRVSTVEAKSGGNEAAIQTLSEVTAGKPDIYNQATAPAGTSDKPLKLGDLWINSNNEISRWNGAAWVKCSDKELTDFKAQAAAATWLKTQVASGGRKVVAGLGLLAGSGNGSEFVILADRFYLAKDKNGELVQPFAVDASDPNDQKVVIEGNLFVQALKKGGYADATGWIIGDKIAAHSKIQLGAGGEFIAGGGAKFQMGNGAVFIDSETAQMMLRDPANLTTGDYIRIISGDISTYKYIAGAYREMKSLRKMSFGSNAENGATVVLDGYWPSAPSIIVSPCALQTFNPSYGTQAQTLLTQASNIVYNKATGRVTFKPVAKLVIDAGRQSIGGESSPATDTVFGQVTAGYRDSGSGQMVYPEVTLQSAAVTIPANATTATIRLNVFANCIASTDVMTGGSGGEGGPGSEYSYSRIESFWCRARTAYVIDGVEYDGWNKDFAAADEEHSYKHNYVAQWLEPSAKTFTLSAGSTAHTIAVKVYVSQKPVTGNNPEQRLTWQEYTPPALINRSFAALRMESVTYNLAAAQPLAQGTLNYMAIAE